MTIDANASELHHIGGVRRATWISLIVNVLLSALKLAGGIVGSSQAIIADGVHSLSDSSTDIAILIGVKFWSRPPDDGHPYGHRRIETLVTVFIGVVLIAASIGLIYNAIVTHQQKHTEAPSWIALVAAIISIVSKEILYRWTRNIGRRLKSSAVIANAWHHRSDAFSSIPTAVAVSVMLLHPSLAFLDHIAAVVVSFFILRVAWNVLKPALKELVDAGASEKDCEKIRAIALFTDGVRKVHAIRTRYVGPGLSVDLHVQVDPEMTVRRGHNIGGEVKSKLLSEGPDVTDVIVHLEPHEPETD
ncbi:MAG: cation transporter [Candidatus Coatesbacteria bacterium]|nr:cation transporter [Candidatus Coatesbacteria bacterium]